MKIPKLEPKMPSLGILRMEFQNNIVLFEISTLQFLKLQKLRQEMKMPRFGIRNALFGYFEAKI